MHTDITPEKDGMTPKATENEHRIKLAPVPLFTVMILLMLLCFMTRELDKGLSISSSSYIKDVGKYLFTRLRCIVLYISVISYSAAAVITAAIYAYEAENSGEVPADGLVVRSIRRLGYAR